MIASIIMPFLMYLKNSILSFTQSMLGMDGIDLSSLNPGIASAEAIRQDQSKVSEPFKDGKNSLA